MLLIAVVIRMQFVGRPCFSLLYSTKVRVSEKIPCKNGRRVSKWARLSGGTSASGSEESGESDDEENLGIDGMSSLDHVKLSQNFMKSSIFFLSEWGYFEGPKSSNIALQDGYMNLMRLPEQVLMSSSFRFWSLVELSCTWRNSRKPPRNPLCSSQFHNSPLLNMEHFISVFHTRLIHYRVESDLQYRSGTVIYLINAHNHSDLILFLSILAFLFF